jgi:Flp pilus assembly protein CpaB
MAWIGAAVVAVGTAAIVTRDLAALHARAGALGPERPAVVAARDLALGVTVTDVDLRIRRVHASQLPPGVLGSRSQALGRIVASPVLADAFVSARNLAPVRRRGVDGILPPGTRALRIVAVDSIRPRRGAAVDVLATYDEDAPFGTGGRNGGPTVVVAAGVLVVGTDDGEAAAASRATRGVGVTLLVGEDQARALADAAVHAVLTLALVPPEDAHPSGRD